MKQKKQNTLFVFLIDAFNQRTKLENNNPAMLTISSKKHSVDRKASRPGTGDRIDSCIDYLCHHSYSLSLSPLPQTDSPVTIKVASLIINFRRGENFISIKNLQIVRGHKTIFGLQPGVRTTLKKRQNKYLSSGDGVFFVMQQLFWNGYYILTCPLHRRQNYLGRQGIARILYKANSVCALLTATSSKRLGRFVRL